MIEKPQRFIRRREVLHRTGLSATALYMLEKRDEFPRHIMLTPRCAVWVEADIEKFIASRLAKPAKLARVPERTRIVRPSLGEAMS